MEQTQETWQIERGGQIFDTNFEEMTGLIECGELLKMDRVRKGNLRWIEAGKVPSLLAVFNAKDGEQPAKPVITLTKLGPTSMPGGSTVRSSPYEGGVAAASADGVVLPEPGQPMCAMHQDVPAAFVCQTCCSNFCKACPKAYGGTVKICPYCGAMCNSIVQMQAAHVAATTYATHMSGGFGFSDFINALTVPFRFKTSLILGALMYMICKIGQGAAGFGGFFMMGATLGAFLLGNTLLFGVLSNTVENFAQGKLDEDFMPSFDEFSLWDDVVHPFFLSIGVWLVSFGPALLLVVITFFFALNTVKGDLNGLQSDAAQMVRPDLPYAANAMKQSEQVREMIGKINEKQKERIASMEHYDKYAAPGANSLPRSIAPEAEEFNRQSKLYEETQKRTIEQINNGENPPSTSETFRAEEEDPSSKAYRRVMEEHPKDTDYEALNRVAAEQRKAQLEGVLGKTPETKSAEQWAMIKQVLAYGFVFLLIGGICLLWGLFYFPAACAVAGYTQSFLATINPTVGFDTIKRLGVDYVKILLMALALAIMSIVIAVILSIVFLPFNMPGLGNLPANAIGALFGFYFAVVFSCILGYALYKAGDRLQLPS